VRVAGFLAVATERVAVARLETVPPVLVVERVLVAVERDLVAVVERGLAVRVLVAVDRGLRAGFIPDRGSRTT
jgi:hypothetical protein